MATTSEIAEKFGTDGKTLRKFFRSDACEIEPVGQGSRYEIDAAEIKVLKKQFLAWSKGKAKKANPATEKSDKEPVAKKTTTSRKKKVEPEVLDDEDLELDEEPTDEALEELEDVDETEDIVDDDSEESEESDTEDEDLELEEDEEEEPEPAPKPRAR